MKDKSKYAEEKKNNISSFSIQLARNPPLPPPKKGQKM